MTLTIERPAPTNGTGKRADVYRGIPVLRLHVDDPLPTPRAPERYAVRVYPDLARYLLSFNHPQNRNQKPSAIAKYVRDMAAGDWAFTPEPLIFSTSGILQNGQNRLAAVELSGASVWLMCDFGWPEDLVETIDRGSARTNADALAISAVPNPNVVAAAIGFVEKYRQTVGTTLRWPGRHLSGAETQQRYRAASEAWDVAQQFGGRTYNATQYGLGPSTWAAAFYLIADAAGLAAGSAFFTELIDETGEAGSATRRLKSHYIRRRLYDTASGDSREPIENIIRAFNAWVAGKPVGFVRTGGSFVLSPIRVR